MIIIIYVLFSVSGLLLLKIGATRAFELSFSSGNFTFKVNSFLLIGMVLYLLAFVTSLIAMKTIDLSFFYPVSASLGYVLVCMLSYFVLKESIGKQQIWGIVLILIGILLMNIKK